MIATWFTGWKTTYCYELKVISFKINLYIQDNSSENSSCLFCDNWEDDPEICIEMQMI